MTHSKQLQQLRQFGQDGFEAFKSHSEEIANALTHGIGLALSLAGLGALVVLAVVFGDAAHITSCAIYGGTLVFLYTASTIYHSARSSRLRVLFRLLDHIGILFLIAGTYTPFAIVLLGGGVGWTLLALVWALAVVGTIYKLFSSRRYGPLFTLFYLAMGWLFVLFIKPMLALMPLGALLWLAAGGISYTAGVVFYAWERLPYNHAVWHLFVLVGSVCHYVAVVRYVIPL